jgi:hypothetical protein
MAMSNICFCHYNFITIPTSRYHLVMEDTATSQVAFAASPVIAAYNWLSLGFRCGDAVLLR